MPTSNEISRQFHLLLAKLGPYIIKIVPCSPKPVNPTSDVIK